MLLPLLPLVALASLTLLFLRLGEEEEEEAEAEEIAGDIARGDTVDSALEEQAKGESSTDKGEGVLKPFFSPAAEARGEAATTEEVITPKPP